MWTLYEGDCFDYLPIIESGSVDMVLCDLPYGSTACKWDTPLPLKELWEQYERVIKDNGAIVLTASQPFTTTLISSNMDLFRYCLVWNKIRVAGFLNANRMPLKCHEDVCVFYKKLPTYNPQMEEGQPYDKTQYNGQFRSKNVLGDYNVKSLENHGQRFPKSILTFSQNWKRQDQLHPTQKPVALFEYLIRTYTNPGDVVLDNCAGSGTTGVACENLNRDSILMEREPEYCNIIRNRLNELSSQTRLKVEA